MENLCKLGVRTALSFTVFTLVLTFAMSMGFIDEEAREISTLFMFEGDGLSTSSLIQGFLVTFSISLINVIFEDKRVLKGMLCMWKIILKLVLSIIITIAAALYYQWFPVDNVYAWLGFLISFFFCSGLAIIVMVYRTRQQDKEYQKMFLEYQLHKGGKNS